MKFSKDFPPQKGDFLTSDSRCNNPVVTRAYRARDKALEQEHPEWKEALRAAGPTPTSERLRQLTAEREALAARLESVGQRIAAVKAKFT